MNLTAVRLSILTGKREEENGESYRSLLSNSGKVRFSAKAAVLAKAIRKGSNGLGDAPVRLSAVSFEPVDPTLAPVGTNTLVASFDTLILAADRLQAAMAELVDAGQARGEIATKRDGGRPPEKCVQRQDTLSPATLADLGITRQRLHEARP